QLMAEYLMEFTIDEINIALKEAVGSRCKTSPPNVIILKAGSASNSNLAVHRTCEMYIEDLNLNQEDSLYIACDEAIFCRLIDYSNNQLKLNPILGQWHTSKDMCSALIIAFSSYGLFRLASILDMKFLKSFRMLLITKQYFTFLSLSR
ncbi:19_t:CDS:1, partial [Dentiscutata heterogama]